jgi:hypothetical protein
MQTSNRIYICTEQLPGRPWSRKVGPSNAITTVIQTAMMVLILLEPAVGPVPAILGFVVVASSPDIVMLFIMCPEIVVHYLSGNYSTLDRA